MRLYMPKQRLPAAVDIFMQNCEAALTGKATRRRKDKGVLLMETRRSAASTRRAHTLLRAREHTIVQSGAAGAARGARRRRRGCARHAAQTRHKSVLPVTIPRLPR